MVVRDIERDEIEFISKTLGCLPVAHVDSLRPEKLATADLVEEVDVRWRLYCHYLKPIPVLSLFETNPCVVTI